MTSGSIQPVAVGRNLNWLSECLPLEYGKLRNVEDYREHAIECLLQSLNAEEISSSISQAWLELAEQGLSSPVCGCDTGPKLTGESP